MLTPGYVKLLKFLQDATIVGKDTDYCWLCKQFFIRYFSLLSLFLFYFWNLSQLSSSAFDGGGFCGAGVGEGLMVVGFVVSAWVWLRLWEKK